MSLLKRTVGFNDMRVVADLNEGSSGGMMGAGGRRIGGGWGISGRQEAASSCGRAGESSDRSAAGREDEAEKLFIFFFQ